MLILRYFYDMPSSDVVPLLIFIHILFIIFSLHYIRLYVSATIFAMPNHLEAGNLTGWSNVVSNNKTGKGITVNSNIDTFNILFF